MAVAAHIRPRDRVADVGCDHARLPVYLLQRGLCREVIALDRAEGPLSRAARTISIHGLTEHVSLRRSDGLAAVGEEEVDTVVIAGMGGETVLSIVAAAPWLKNKRLIVQPQTLQRSLPLRLEEMGYVLRGRNSVTEGRRSYEIYLFSSYISQ